MLFSKSHVEHTSLHKPLNYLNIPTPAKYFQIMDLFVKAHNLYTRESTLQGRNPEGF